MILMPSLNLIGVRNLASRSVVSGPRRFWRGEHGGLERGLWGGARALPDEWV